MKMHSLKVWDKFYWKLYDGTKTFEIRKNDRNFQVGDILYIRAYDREKAEYMDFPQLTFTVTYITDYEQKPEYVVMSIVRV